MKFRCKMIMTGGLESTRQRAHLVGRAVRYETIEANDLSIEDGDTLELFCLDWNLPRLTCGGGD